MNLKKKVFTCLLNCCAYDNIITNLRVKDDVLLFLCYDEANRRHTWNDLDDKVTNNAVITEILELSL